MSCDYFIFSRLYIGVAICHAINLFILGYIKGLPCVMLLIYLFSVIYKVCHVSCD